jgi:photosystem II stability/assembly factor-like uncharacterized protein
MVNRIAAAVVGLAIAGLGAAVTAGVAVAAPAASVRQGPPGGPVPRGFEVVSFTFVSANDGWVLGTTKTCAHAPCTSVLRTTNGGRSWVGIPAPKFKLASFESTPGLQRLRFADASDGFAFGSQLWVTHNGGSSWYRVSQVPGSIGDLEASDGVVYAASQQGSKVSIYASPAGTDSWHRVSGLPQVSGFASLGTITLHGKAAWIILGTRLYSTQNGTTWTRESVRCPALLGISSVAAFSTRQVTLLCTGNPGAGQTEKILYVSGDGGTHFTKVGPAPLGGDSGLVAEPTPSHLFVATASGATIIYASTNAGRSWHNGLFLPDGGLGWSDFGFTTASQGEGVEGRPALGPSVLWITRDGGTHWSKVKF